MIRWKKLIRDGNVNRFLPGQSTLNLDCDLNLAFFWRVDEMARDDRGILADD
jgi:hypothetical protein